MFPSRFKSAAQTEEACGGRMYSLLVSPVVKARRRNAIRIIDFEVFIKSLAE
jgi:hypothetical protein